MNACELFRKDFEGIAIHRPDGTALTYAQLYAKADALAAALKKAGAGDGEILAIIMPRCEDYIVATICCIRYGYGYVMMSTDYPQERIDFILEDTGVKLIIDQEFFDRAIKNFYVEANALNEEANAKYTFTPAPEATSVIVYTSGSTGKPKGVRHSWNSLGTVLTGLKETFKPEKDDIFSAIVPFTFAIYHMEILLPLSVGASAIIADINITRSPANLADFFYDNNVSISYMPPKLLKCFHSRGGALRTVLTSSEKIVNLAPQNYRLLGAYGMSETCCVVIFFDIDKAYENTPLGTPMPGVGAYILDENGNEADEGQLCITGCILTEYINNPEKNAQAIVENPFKDRDGNSKMLHTGDLVRRDPDGNIIYLNRMDWMVKINGQRVEPGEVEAVVRRSDGILEVAIKDFKNKYDQTYLVAYFTADRKIPVEEIREKLVQALPAYMVPAFIIQLDAMPVNANGKLDRAALKEPDASLFLTEYAAPENEMQEAICRAIQKILDIEKVGINDDFFVLGGDSIKAMIMTQHCADADCNITVNDIFTGRTPKNIAQLAADHEQPKEEFNPDTESADLTESQMGVYLDSVSDAESCKYNIPFALSFPVNLIDTEKFAHSFEKVIQTHQAFRLGITQEKGIPKMVKIAEPLPEIQIIKASEKEYQEIKNSFVKPFTLDGGFMFRALLVETPYSLHFLFDMYHLLFDGTSMEIFEKQLKRAYEGEELQKESSNPFLKSFREEQFKNGTDIEENYKFFQEYLDGAETSCGPLPDVDKKELVGKKESIIAVTHSGSAKIEQFVKKVKVTENTFFVAAFALALSKFSGMNDVAFVSVSNGRRGKDMLDAIGMFVQTFPVQTKIDEENSVADFLNYVQERFFGAMAHGRVSFAELAKRTGVNASVKIVYQAEMLNGITINGNFAEAEMLNIDDAMGDLDFLVFKQEGSYKIKIDGRSSIYSRSFLESFAELYLQIVEELLSAATLKEMNLLGNAAQRLLDGFNKTEASYDNSQSVVSIFRETAKKYSEKCAVSFNGNDITYGQLDAETDKIAAYIQSKGIGRDEFVSVLVGRNEFMAVAPLGVLKAGAAYQPLDPTYPAERLNFMIGDCKARLLICDRKLRDIITEFDGEVLFTDEIAGLPKPDAKPNADVKPEDAFVIIYTSGTTGTPKGCVIEHKNVVALFRNHCKAMEIDSASNVANYASFGFDAGVMDTFTTLMAGAGLYIIPEETRLDISQLDKFYIENKITQGFMTTQVGRMFIMNTKCQTLKAFTIGGEKLVPFNPPKNFKVVNGYGPSETLAYISSYVLQNDGLVQPIGKPSENTKLYIIDGFGRRLPAGACGELCIAGPQVSRGYLGRPEKTAEAFTVNPFTNQAGYEVMYRTGDVCRILPDGNADFVGRADGQVKIRGFRVELTEVEQVIRSFEGIKNATVQAFDDPAGGKMLVAYVVAEEEIDIDALNEFICNQKPAYMVPRVTMQIDQIPLNVNSKVDKRKLPVPEIKAEEIVPAQNLTQEKILGIVIDILGTDKIGINTDLFMAGLTSIGCIRLNAELQDEFQVPVQTKDLNKAGNVKNLAEFIDKNAKDGKVAAAVEAAKEPEYPDYPITKTQEGIFVESISRPNSTIYNIPLLLKVDDAIDFGRLKSAIVQAVDAHSYMCTKLFYDEKGQVRQKRPAPGSFGREDIQMLTGASIEELAAELVKPFGLINERLFRIALIEAGGKYIFIDVHHIISDGTSVNILLSDIGKAYRGEGTPAEKYTGFDKAADELRARNSTEFNDAEDYYKNLLGGYDIYCLPPSDVHARAKKGNGSFAFRGQAGLADKLKAYAKANGTSANAVICAAFGFMLTAYNGASNTIFTTVHNGRGDSRLGRTFSMLVKTLPVLYEPKTENIAEYVQAMGRQLMDSELNDIYSFAEISHEFGVKSDAMLVFQGDGFEFKEFCGLNCKEVPLKLSEEKAPYACQVALIDGALDFVVDYDNDRFTEALVMSMTQSFENVVSEFISKKKFKEICMANGEQIKVLDEINRTEVPYDESQSVVSMFESAAAKDREKLAVSFKDKNITYGELDDVTDRLAAFVNAKGIGRDEFVSVLVGRNEFMVIASLGIVKAGAAYQPLDPTYPAERLNFMIKDCGARLLICDRELRSIVTEFDGDVLFTDEIAGLPKPDAKLNVNVKPEDAFVIIYTSGTTGTPKGCVIEQRNMVCLFWNDARIMEYDENSRYAMYASFGFDAGVQSIYTTLLAGATIYIIPEEIRLDIALLDEFYVKNGITQGFMTTQVGRMFILNTKCKTLKTFIMGGEKLVPFNPDVDFKVMNGYGPSETFCYVTSYVIGNASMVQPIGVGHKNTKLYVIDKYGHRLPAGACGELCISGNQVARGYLGRPEKTAECFVKNPFCDEPSYERMYRTGDTVRMLPDGNYDYVGRGDGQVKIRGFRIELTEVEQTVRNFQGIKNATVQALDDPAGGKMLVAYVVGDGKIDVNALNDFIRSQKPAYMVPQVTIQMDEIPLNPNGKVDKKKLPAPELSADRVGTEPANQTEEAICRIFADLLGRKKVYADDDFFEIGGTSISALQLVIRLENEGFKIVYKNLFENTTPQQLAEFIKGGKENKDFYAPSGADAKKYDYSALEYNVIKNLPQIKPVPIGNVLLTGATGFLGSHVLEYLLDNTDSHITCIVRDKNGLLAYDRLETIMTFYFERELDDERITVISGDLVDPEIEKKLENLDINTILNCAADVRHFGVETDMMRDNLQSIEAPIKLAKATGAMLVQASSLSVSGESVNGHIPFDKEFRENELNIGQSLENMYIRSKYLAEQRIIDEVSRGMRGKIIRLGNLQARTPDGEFQINADGNAFLKALKAYAALGCYNVDMLDAPQEFTPIDYAARAMVLLAGTPDKFTVFHVNNCHHVHMANVLETMAKLGIKIDFVDPDTFHQAYVDGLKDEKISQYISGMVLYMNTVDEDPTKEFIKANEMSENNKVGVGEVDRRKIAQNNDFTTKALYRLGFSWPLVDYAYLERLLEIQVENGYFDVK